MAKILRNDSSPAVDITLKSAGATISPGASNKLTIDVSEYPLWASEDVISEITPHITSGDIVVNDGTYDLDVTSGINYLKSSDAALNQRFTGNTSRSNGFPDNISTQEAVEFAKTTVSGKMQDFEFTTTGNTFDKWVNIAHPSDSSNITPFISLWSGNVIGISFANKNDDASTDLEIYVNDVLQYTWEIRNKRWAYITNESGLLTLAQGDRVSIFAKKVTGGGITNPAGISGEIMSVINSVGNNSGGSDVR